jgi:hypothetical protein
MERSVGGAVVSQLVRAGAVLALAACGWIAWHGLSSTRVSADLPRTSVPWDADGLPPDAPDARLLLLRPTDDRVRVRDALARAKSADGERFRVAAEGVDRHARANPDGLLLVAAAALARWKERREPEDLRVGERLLRTFLRRRPAHHDEAPRVLWDALGAEADPRSLAAGLPPALAADVGQYFSTIDPDAAWDVLVPALTGPAPLDERHARAALVASANRRDGETARVLRSLAARADLPQPIREEVVRALEAADRGDGLR